MIALTAQLDGEAKTFGTRPPVKRGQPRSAGPTIGVEFRLAALPAPVEILVGDVDKSSTRAQAARCW